MFYFQLSRTIIQAWRLTCVNTLALNTSATTCRRIEKKKKQFTNPHGDKVNLQDGKINRGAPRDKDSRVRGDFEADLLRVQPLCKQLPFHESSYLGLIACEPDGTSR